MSSLDDLNVFVSSDPRVEEERKRLEDAKQEKRQRNKKTLPLLIPALIVALLLLSTLPSYAAKSAAYKDAQNLLYAGKFDEAKEAFEALGNYSDSADQAQYNVEYYRALSIAEEGDALIDNQGEMAVERYEEAIAMLKSLNGYGESENQIELIEAKISAYDESVREGEYEKALQLQSEGKYKSAKEAFELLGNYRDSADQAKECIYLRAMKLVEYIRENEVRNVYANPTYDKEDFTIEVTKYPVLEMRPICDVAAEELLSLGDYKDSAEIAAECQDKGDFKKEFLEYCANGQINEAIAWLSEYDDVFEQRDSYSAMIERYYKYVGEWELFKGDPSVLPLSAGVNKKCSDFEVVLTIADNNCFLTLVGKDVEFEIRLSLADTGNSFMACPDGSNYYYAIINDNKHLTYTRYDSSGKTVSSCEYNAA